MTTAPTLIVCGLADAPDAVRRHNPEIAISLVLHGEAPHLRSERCTQHHIDCADVLHSRGRYRAPDAADVEHILDAADAWTGDRPMLIHCGLGRRRSWAAALIVACYLTEEAPSAVIERMFSLAPWADPHAGMVELGDTVIGEPGALSEAMLSTHAEMHSLISRSTAAPLVVMPLGLRRKAVGGHVA